MREVIKTPELGRVLSELMKTEGLSRSALERICGATKGHATRWFLLERPIGRLYINNLARAYPGWVDRLADAWATDHAPESLKSFFLDDQQKPKKEQTTSFEPHRLEALCRLEKMRNVYKKLTAVSGDLSIMGFATSVPMTQIEEALLNRMRSLVFDMWQNGEIELIENPLKRTNE